MDDSLKESAAKTFSLCKQIREFRAAGKTADESSAKAAVPEQFWRGVYDLQGQGVADTGDEWMASLALLPGIPIRLEGQPVVEDTAVNEAYDNCLKVLDFYKEVFNYDSIDGYNMHVVSSGHFGQGFANAMWTAGPNQMIYGDGNEVLYNFTAAIDVIGDEMTVCFPCPPSV
jgi:Zn-dependent metalloprotease